MKGETSMAMKNGLWKPRGCRFWWMQYRHGGKTIRESTRCTRLGDAKDALAAKKTASAEGRLVPDARKVTFDDGVRLLTADAEKKGNRSRRKLAHLAEHFAGVRLVDITTARVWDYEARRISEGAARATVNQELSVLRRLFTLAVEAGKVATRPVIKTPDPKNARKGFVTEKQFAAVRDELPAHLGLVWAFAYYTGWRLRSEILPLTWQNVDWKSGVVRIEVSKNDEPREFPFADHPPLKAVLVAAHRARGPFVFHAGGKRIKYESWNDARRAACKVAGVEAIAHDLRRTAVRNLERAGVSRSVAMSLTGHKTEAVYRRYAIVDSAAQREGVSKLARSLQPQAKEQA
jgi:integrase